MGRATLACAGGRRARDGTAGDQSQSREMKLVRGPPRGRRYDAEAELKDAESWPNERVPPRPLHVGGSSRSMTAACPQSLLRFLTAGHGVEDVIDRGLLGTGVLVPLPISLSSRRTSRIGPPRTFDVRRAVS